MRVGQGVDMKNRDLKEVTVQVCGMAGRGWGSE